MLQDEVFQKGEGDGWFMRNKDVLMKEKKHDWPIFMIELLKEKKNIKSVLDIGCSNGWRLGTLAKILDCNCQFSGIDASSMAIETGKSMFPQMNLVQATMSKIPLEKTFDLVMVNFVLHWVDRKTLCKSIAEIDRMVADNGILVISDFMPNYQQKRKYHHYTEQVVYTYKQDYMEIFKALGSYQELSRNIFNHDNGSDKVDGCSSDERAVCAIMKKSNTGYYEEK